MSKRKPPKVKRKLRHPPQRTIAKVGRGKGKARVLIACEFSGRVREAFRASGCDAWSNDITVSNVPGPHLQGDARKFLDLGWDLLIAHPPCTYLACSGARWQSEERSQRREEALEFVRALLRAPVPRVAVENPVSVISTHIRKPDQIIQPWWFGDGYSKSTCLWLRNLPPLVHTRIVKNVDHDWYNFSPGPNRRRYRSITPYGLALAMARQWGSLLHGT